ncbi:MAG TPA: hypothetical protein VKA94_01875 [Hyphomicrobiales bacterium]|nr:hypothetical protein [Hyphomicrobiales bacterium]
MNESDGDTTGGNPEKKDDRSDSIFGWAYRMYQRYDKWKGRYEWFDWLMSFFKTHTATSVAITSGTAAVTVAAAVVVANPDLRRQYLPFLSSTETVQTESWGSSVIYPIEGNDEEGRHAAFDVAVLPQDLTWSRRSDSDLDQAGTLISNANVPDRIFTPELRQGLSRSGALIAIGLASQEGQLSAETARALRRGTTAAEWLASINGENKPIWVLNLGQFTGNCEAVTDKADTSWQRPLIVVGIRSQEPQVDIDEAFADAISDKSNLPSRECYTSFDLTRFR